MSVHRRQFLLSGLSLAVTATTAPPFAWAKQSPAVAALEKSQLIYLTPIVSGGKESACHGEVWFVTHQGDVFVVTKADAWRSEAIRRGFTQTNIWIGEFGPWKRAQNAYRSAPFLQLQGQLEVNKSVHQPVLEAFGHKYAAEWDSWGPRFHRGMTDGTRVMLRYTISQQ